MESGAPTQIRNPGEAATEGGKVQLKLLIEKSCVQLGTECGEKTRLQTDLEVIDIHEQTIRI